MDDETAEIIGEFLGESADNLDQLDRDLLSLEANPGDRDVLAGIFRTIHTIKGTAGFLAFNNLEKLAHAGESLLSRLRDGKQSMDQPITDALLEMEDKIREMLGQIEAEGKDDATDTGELVARLKALIVDGPAPAPAAPAPTVAEPAAAAPEPVSPEPAAPVAEPVAPAPVAEPVAPAPAAAASPHRRSVAESSIRVDVDLLDDLMRMVGELVLTRNQLMRNVSGLGDSALARTSQQLSVITSELQGSVMKTRMQPIEHVWTRLPRVVRDLSNGLGKQIRVEMRGQDTELDRSLLEAVKDPLTHLVRNSVDHGIETPEVRVAAGKPAEGTLVLSAYHESGHVVVEVTDDGAGLDPERIGTVAVERGVVTPDELAAMRVGEIQRLIMRPGFSTSEKVTKISGRGVGMDVVKSNIEAIGGSVEITSTPGAGATFRLAIPLTLAIVQALSVESSGEQFVIAQSAVRELVHASAGSAQRIEYISGAPVMRLRGSLMPLVRLDETLQLPGRAETAAEDVYVAVLEDGGTTFGLVVDRVLDTEEIVVKALSQRVNEAGLFTGASVMGDGTVALILDVGSLARRANVSAAALARAADEAETELRRPEENAARYLTVGVGGHRVAVPLEAVTRLEEIDPSTLEMVGRRTVVQYRGHIVPFVRLTDLLGTGGTDDEASVLPTIVYTRRGRSVALAVDSIEDIVEDESGAHSPVSDGGLIGSSVIGGKVTELLDIHAAVLVADPDFYDEDVPVDDRQLMAGV